MIGLATKGDIRGKLLTGFSIEDPISCCANTNFIWADQSTPREVPLKQLGNNIRFIPLLENKDDLWIS